MLASVYSQSPAREANSREGVSGKRKRKYVYNRTAPTLCCGGRTPDPSRRLLANSVTLDFAVSKTRYIHQLTPMYGTPQCFWHTISLESYSPCFLPQNPKTRALNNRVYLWGKRTSIQLLPLTILSLLHHKVSLFTPCVGQS